MSTSLRSNTDRKSNDRKSKRGMIVGTTAGLLGGAGVGLLFAVPSFTNAASTDSSSETVSAAVVAQDATSTDDATDDATDADRPEPGVRLRAVLQPLVVDGTITAAQADAVTAQLVANRPEGGHGGLGGHRGHRGFDGEVVAGVLGIDADTLRTELQDGKTIAEIAAEQGVDVQTVIDALVSQAQTHLDQAVTDGRLTEDEAATKLVEITAKITDRVNNGRPASD